MRLPIENTPRDYAWGGIDAISSLLGMLPSGGPEAELWLGTHPGSPARIVGDGRDLGEVVGELPFLMKVLAAAEPLSLQVHPDRLLAEAGFAREEAAGLPRNAPTRVYRDPSAKAELIYALSDTFEALNGLRPGAESAAALAPLVAESGADATPLLARLADDTRVGGAFLWLFGDDPAARVLVDALLNALPRLATRYPAQMRMAELHPGDAGIIASLLLNHVVLAKGEAMYIAPGTVHAYLRGTGIELLSSSDNVVRGGLTPKHVDLAELASLLDRAAAPAAHLDPVIRAAGGVEFLPPAPAPFRLLVVTDRAEVELEGPAIALCLTGEFVVEGAGEPAELRRGAALCLTDATTPLRITGRGELVLAH